VAFLGPGAMGQGMVPNLLRAGHAVTVHKRTPERMKPAGRPPQGRSRRHGQAAEENLEQARAVLEPISETLHHMSEAGNGYRMKLVGNLLVALRTEESESRCTPSGR
jgi:3-hydroxyisobutyrate dehydrogenase-like beta-hydroxyacid dehydrogenase